MNCYTHTNRAAAGICAICQKAVCHDCVGRDTPRLVCRECVARGPLLFGWEYKSMAAIGGWPLIHICAGIDPVTMRPRAAKGVIALGNIAIGGIAMGGLAIGLVSVGGLSIGLACALEHTRNFGLMDVEPFRDLLLPNALVVIHPGNLGHQAHLVQSRHSVTIPSSVVNLSRGRRVMIRVPP